MAGGPALFNEAKQSIQSKIITAYLSQTNIHLPGANYSEVIRNFQ